MLSKLPHAQHFLLAVTPLIASFTVANSASLAATLAFSKSEFQLNDFSHSPLCVGTLTDSQTQTFSSSGQVRADANSQASFISCLGNPAQTQAANLSFSFAEGEGSSYFGIAESLAAVIGYNFRVDSEEFAVNFDGLLNLRTEIDDRQSESAIASGNIFFLLTNSLTGEVIDYFALYGGLNTPDQGNYLDYFKSSDNITFLTDPSFTTDFSGNTKYATASVQGKYSRSFDSLTYLTLLELKTNKASVKAPEPSATLALLFCCILAIGYTRKTKALNP
jgi:hypothetical protein